MPDRLSESEMITRAARGLGKVDQQGIRGITLVTVEEIEAMAAMLACLGLKPIYPGEAASEPQFYPPKAGETT